MFTPPPDPGLPALADLLDPERARPLLQAALADAGEVVEVRPSQARHDRGRRVVVRYAVRGLWRRAWTPVQTLVAQHGAAPPTPNTRGPGATVVGEGSGRVWIWRYPFDPYLPGLAAAARPARVQSVLHDVVGGGPVRVVPRAYRPTRRAVLQVRSAATADTGADVCYIKVVRPSRLRRIVEAHRIVAAATATPAVLRTVPPQGVLVLEALRGATLREVLLDDGRATPPPEALLDLQLRLLDRPTTHVPPARTASIPRHADVLAVLLPQHAAVVRQVARVAEAADEGAADGPVGIVHGDLHAAQVVVAPGGSLGVLDLDGLGVGPLTDDCATALAHLHVLVQRAAQGARIAAWAGEYEAACAEIVPADVLRHRTAGVLLGLAAGGFTAQRPGWHETAVMRLGLAAALAGLDVDV